VISTLTDVGKSSKNIDGLSPHLFLSPSFSSGVYFKEIFYKQAKKYFFDTFNEAVLTLMM